MLAQFKEVDIATLFDLLTVNAIWVDAPQRPFHVSTDPDDDKFLARALASRSKIVVSGDKHLLAVSGYKSIKVIKPSLFIERHLKKRKR